MNSVYAPLKNRSAARRGTSLIEILVVLVILVFGILSVIRLFPAGFLVFRASQNHGVGQRVAQSLLETITKDTNSIADGVYVYNDAFGFDPTIAPNDLTPYKNDPANPAFSDINKARYVRNETIIVPPARLVLPTIPEYSSASVHVLNYGPAIINGDKAIEINSAPWTAQLASSVTSNGVPVDNPDDLLTPGQPQYLIDYDTHQIAIASANYVQNYVFNVTVKDGNPVVQKTVSVSGSLAALDSGWKAVDLTSAGVSASATWIVGTAILYRPFTRGDTGVPFANHTLSPFTDDPYQFQVRYGSYGPHAANVGVIDFNPLAGGSNGTQPLKARISYLVYNWHILHEDHALPYKSEDRTVRLGIDNLKKIGDVQHDQSLFKGIFDSTTTDAADIMVCNLDTGATSIYETNVAGSAVDLDGDAPNAGLVGISYKNGRVTFPLDSNPNYNDPNPSPNSNGVHIRIYYMGTADWGVALQKAPARFLPTSNKLDLVTNSAAPPNLYWVRSTGGALGVCFPNCDYGKTVEISGVLNYTDTGGNAAIMAIPSITSAINNPDQISSKDIGYINVGPIPANCDTTKPMSISSVRGVSADALVVWRENDQWKSQIVDTLLPRN